MKDSFTWYLALLFVNEKNLKDIYMHLQNKA